LQFITSTEGYLEERRQSELLSASLESTHLKTLSTLLVEGPTLVEKITEVIEITIRFIRNLEAVARELPKEWQATNETMNSTSSRVGKTITKSTGRRE
jgi:hypothetical protein